MYSDSFSQSLAQEPLQMSEDGRGRLSAIPHVVREARLRLLLLCYRHGTSGSLTARCLIDSLILYGAACRTSPKAKEHLTIWGEP